jgi:hypothetical protein
LVSFKNWLKDPSNESKSISKYLESALKDQHKLIKDPDQFYSDLLNRFPHQTPNRVSPLRIDSMSVHYSQLLDELGTHLEVIEFINYLQSIDTPEVSELEPLIHFFDSVPSFKNSEGIMHLLFLLRSFQIKSASQNIEKHNGSYIHNEPEQMTSNMITNLVHKKLEGPGKFISTLNENSHIEQKSTYGGSDIDGIDFSGSKSTPSNKKSKFKMVNLDNVHKNLTSAFKIVLSRIFKIVNKKISKILKQFGNFYDSERDLFLYDEFERLLQLGLIYSNKEIISSLLNSIKSLMNIHLKLGIDIMLMTCSRVFEKVNDLCLPNSLNGLVELSNHDSTLIRFNYMGEKITPIELFFHLTNSQNSFISSNAPHLFRDPEASDTLRILEQVSDFLTSQLETLFLFYDESRVRGVLVRLLDLSPTVIKKLSISLFTKISFLTSQYLRFFYCRESRLVDSKDLEINFVLEKFYNFQMNFFSERKMNFRDGTSLMVFQESDKILQTLSTLHIVFENISNLDLLDSKNKKNRIRKNIEKIYKTMKVKDNLKHPIGREYIKLKNEYLSLKKVPLGYGEMLNLVPSKFNISQHQSFGSRPMFDFYGNFLYLANF